MADVKEEIVEILRDTGRAGIESLIHHMEVIGFFEAPCSGSHHLAVKGGLAEHSLNVFHTMCSLASSVCADVDVDSLALVSILHDLGKCGDHGKPNYVPNMLKSGQSASKPFKTNPELLYEEHEIRSVLIAERFIPLSEEEESAILHHNGLFGKLDSAYGNANYCATELAFFLHTADMFCSRFLEVSPDGEN